MRVLWLGTLGALSLLALFAAMASAQICPNEALRSELRSGRLPDCRAYELVTPAYKESQTETSVYAISEDGAHMVATSLGVFAGAEEDKLGTQFQGDAYEFSRTPSGWRTFSLGPPISAYLSDGMFDTSADLAHSLWQLGKRPPAGSLEAEQPEHIQTANSVDDYYIESSPGVFVDIGRPTPDPTVPNRNKTTYLGASSDLSHILFSTEPGFHWPFDKTAGGASPLYEYVGTGYSAPMLVGVHGGRGSDELLSQCGTRLGSSEPTGGGSMYNAISASGSRVFFTAVGTDEASGCEGPPVAELFAREELPLASGELPAANMRTLAISEPSEEDCKMCLTGEGSRADAVFQGASRDGSKIFFLTAQELLPGAKGENLYEYDFDGPKGAKVSLVSGGAISEDAEVQGVARVSEDGSAVYFVAGGRLTEALNDHGHAAEAGKDNLYVYERNERHPEGHTAFIATLTPGDAADWARADFRSVFLSSDDRFLIFASVVDLTNEGASGSQIYQYDSQTGVLVRASIGQRGYNNNGKMPVYGSALSRKLPIAYAYTVGDSPTQAAGVLAPADGVVFFESPDALTPGALNDQLDALGEPVPNLYEYRNGGVHLITDGRDTSIIGSAPSSELIGSSASGEDLFFTTSDPLIGEDADSEQDIYDARVEGGFPAAEVSACGEETCRGALSQAPALTQALAVPIPEVAQPPAATQATKAKGKTKTKTVRKSRRKRGKKARKAASHRHARGGVGRS
jgi:hypothetical protein